MTSAVPASQPGPNAPVDAAARVRFIHTADWQLGMRRKFLGPDAQGQYTAARRDAIGRIAELAEAEQVDFVVVAGDVFESPHVGTEVIRQALDVLARFTVPVYLLPGNHDPLDTASIYHSAAFTRGCPAHVHVLDRDDAFPIDGVRLIPATWHSKRPTTEMVGEQVRRLAPTTEELRIMVGHGAVDALLPDDVVSFTAIDSGAVESALTAGAVDFVALGDRHSATSIGGTARLWYSGSPEVTAFDDRETDSGQVLVVTLTRSAAGLDSEVTPHRVGQWSFHAMNHEITSAADISVLRDLLHAVGSFTTTVVRLRLRGVVSAAENAELADLLDEFNDRFAALDTDLSRLTLAPTDTDFDDAELSGFAAEALEELRVTAETDETAQRAIGLLHRMVRGQA